MTIKNARIIMIRRLNSLEQRFWTGTAWADDIKDARIYSVERAQELIPSLRWPIAWVVRICYLNGAPTTE